MLGEAPSVQVSTRVFSRSSIRAVLLRSTAAAGDGWQGKGYELLRTPARAAGIVVSTCQGLHAHMVNEQKDQL